MWAIVLAGLSGMRGLQKVHIKMEIKGKNKNI